MHTTNNERSIFFYKNQPDIFALLIQSLCPSIYGLDVIKAGLLLSMLGGSESINGRDTIHTLIVGDPGLGKSQLLRSVSNLSNRYSEILIE